MAVGEIGGAAAVAGDVICVIAQGEMWFVAYTNDSVKKFD